MWTVPGNRIANYVVVCNGPLQGDGATECQNPTSGTVTPLTNLNTQSLTYYWVDGADGRQITYSVKVDNKTFTGRATFNVKRPTAQVTATTGAVSIDNLHPSSPFSFHYGLPSPNTPSIKFTRTITFPSGFTVIHNGFK